MSYNRVTREKSMKEILDMTEAHLTNVSQQIDTLRLQRDEIDNEINRLVDYLNKGAEILDSYRTEKQENASSV